MMKKFTDLYRKIMRKIPFINLITHISNLIRFFKS